MKITEVRVRKVNAGSLKANVSITLDDAFVVHDLKVIQGKEGLFVSMPSRKIEDGKFIDTAHPINKEFRQELIDAVLAKYNEAE